jgi:hypothetical protein
MRTIFLLFSGCFSNQRLIDSRDIQRRKMDYPPELVSLILLWCEPDDVIRYSWTCRRARKILSEYVRVFQTPQAKIDLIENRRLLPFYGVIAESVPGFGLDLLSNRAWENFLTGAKHLKAVSWLKSAFRTVPPTREEHRFLKSSNYVAKFPRPQKYSSRMNYAIFFLGKHSEEDRLKYYRRSILLEEGNWNDPVLVEHHWQHASFSILLSYTRKYPERARALIQSTDEQSTAVLSRLRRNYLILAFNMTQQEKIDLKKPRVSLSMEGLTRSDIDFLGETCQRIGIRPFTNCPDRVAEKELIDYALTKQNFHLLSDEHFQWSWFTERRERYIMSKIGCHADPIFKTILVQFLLTGEGLKESRAALSGRSDKPSLSREQNEIYRRANRYPEILVFLIRHDCIEIFEFDWVLREADKPKFHQSCLEAARAPRMITYLKTLPWPKYQVANFI